MGLIGNIGSTDISAKADKTNVLELDNTTAFTPNADYEPATKKYVDDNAGGGFFNKIDATTAPTVNDDSGDGYEIGSLWIDVTHDLIYQCTDATVGAAVWKCLSSVILDDAPSDGDTYGRKDGAWAMIITSAVELVRLTAENFADPSSTLFGTNFTFTVSVA